MTFKYLNVKKYQYIVNIYPWGPTFSPFHSALSFFPEQKVKNWKYIEWPGTDLKHFTVKSTVYTLSNYPSWPKCSSVLLDKQSISRYNVVENRKCREYHQHSTLDSQKHPCAHWIFTLKPKFGLFRVTSGLFRDAMLSKIANMLNDLRMTMNT